jgi:hypothetical protein
MHIVRSLVWVCLVGCGGALGSPTGDGGQDAAADSPTANDGGTPPPCPSSPPAPNGACTSNGTKCEWGTNPDPNCNQIFICMNGSWVDQTSGTICAPQSDCPTSYASVPVNQNCTENNLSCAYPQGECICTQAFGGVERQTPAWDCFPAETGCPAPRPDIGTSCTGTVQCDYGSCSGGVSLSCVNGIWQEAAVLCPN